MQLVSAAAIVAFAVVMILFGSKLDISSFDALRLVLALWAPPLALVLMQEGLALLYGLWVESLRGTLRFRPRGD